MLRVFHQSCRNQETTEVPMQRIFRVWRFYVCGLPDGDDSIRLVIITILSVLD
jgi:hypothetical protein